MIQKYFIDGMYYTDDKGCNADVLIRPPIKPLGVVASVVANAETSARQSCKRNTITATQKSSDSYTTITLHGLHSFSCPHSCENFHGDQIIEQAVQLVMNAMQANKLTAKKR